MLPRLDRPHEALRAERRRGIAVLGSTGSIGTQTLEIAELFPERLAVQSLAAGNNWELLAEQARRHQPQLVAIGELSAEAPLREALADLPIEVVSGEDGLAMAATADDAELVVAAIVGFAGLRSTIEALRAGRDVALANKEALVVAGELAAHLSAVHGGAVLPVDSEHSAIFQCLLGEVPGSIESITLTASGGPFRERSLDSFDAVTPAEALRHPNWNMGAKITIDSATMMNKGLEVIEAHWLFGLEADQISVLIHPQSIIHSLVAFTDGSVKAQLGVPDMRVPIQFALSFPERWTAPHPRIDWPGTRCLDFDEPEPERYPALGLAYDALREGGAAPTVLNAANEEAVALFLQAEIRFTDIHRLVAAALEHVPSVNPLAIDELDAADAATRARVRELHTSLTI